MVPCAHAFSACDFFRPPSWPRCSSVSPSWTRVTFRARGSSTSGRGPRPWLLNGPSSVSTRELRFPTRPPLHQSRMSHRHRTATELSRPSPRRRSRHRPSPTEPTGDRPSTATLHQKPRSDRPRHPTINLALGFLVFFIGFGFAPDRARPAATSSISFRSTSLNNSFVPPLPFDRRSSAACTFSPFRFDPITRKQTRSTLTTQPLFPAGPPPLGTTTRHPAAKFADDHSPGTLFKLSVRMRAVFGCEDVSTFRLPRLFFIAVLSLPVWCLPLL